METLKQLTIDDLKNFEVTISFTSIIYTMVLAAFCGEIIARVYRKYATTLGNRVAFSESFWLLAAITATVIMIVKFSLALSLGLVGALSIVRFRAAIKEPEELVYLFLIIAIGLAAGAGQLLGCISITLFTAFAIFIRNHFKKNNEKITSLGDVDILSVDAPNSEFNLFERYATSQETNLSYELMSLTSSKDIYKATYRLNSDMTQEEKKELLNWISQISKKNISISLSKTIKLDQ